MSDKQHGSNLGRQYFILYLTTAALVVGLGYVFRQTGMLVVGSPSQGLKTSAEMPEASWEDQIAAVQHGESDRIEITQTLIDDQRLAQLSHVPHLRELILDHTSITDAGLAPLLNLSELEHLRLRGARITDRGLREICRIPSLKRLNLPQADLTDAGLAELASLDQLELLRLGSPRVTNAGIEKIATLKSLRWLHLIDIPLTDPALQSIARLENLESLYLDGARISDDAYEEFFRLRPGIHLHVDQKHHDRDPHRTSHSH
jgi:Leucine-rich repeat (LRR) protein